MSTGNNKQLQIDPNSSVLLVIDMQNDACTDEGVYARHGFNVDTYQAIIPRIKKLVEAVRKVGIPVVYSVHEVRSNHADAGKFIARLRPFMVKEGLREHTWGARIVDELAPQPGDFVVRKHRHSVFFESDFETILRGLDTDTIIVTGTATHMCVEGTVRDATMRDYNVVLVEDCCASRDMELHKAAVRIMSNGFAEMTTLRSLVRQVEPTAKNRPREGKKSLVQS